MERSLTGLVVVMVIMIMGASVWLVGCTTTETTTTAQTEAGAVTQTVHEYVVDTAQISELIGIAQNVGNLVTAYQAANTPTESDDSVLDQVAATALAYIQGQLGVTPKAIPSAAEVRQATIEIAMQAHHEAGAFPPAEQIAVYVLSGTRPSVKDLRAWADTGTLQAR